MKRACRIEYTPEAVEHLARLRARERATVLDVVPRQLTHEPTVATRNRKLLRANDVAPWELRIGNLRVYYDVVDEMLQPIVTVRDGACDPAQGPKPRPRRPGGEQAVKTVEMAEATASLSVYARGVRKETLVVTRKGKPVAALMAVGSHTDLENLAVTTDPGFMAMIERSRRLYPAGSGLTTEQVRARLAARRKAPRKLGKSK